MKKILLSIPAALAVLMLSGCALSKVAEGITTKNVSGNGTVIDSHIGLNTDTKIPELRTLFISGDIATTKAGTNAISYREESSSSVWNAKSVTKKRFLSITLNDSGNIPATIMAIADIFRESGAGNAPTVEVKTASAEATAAAEAKPAEMTAEK